MRITNSFFGATNTAYHQVFYSVPARDVTRVGYAIAEFDAARSAVKGAFQQANWDGYGALPIGDDTRGNAIGALNQIENLTCAPEVTPNPNGTLSFEWESAKGFGLLEIGRTRYSFYLQPYRGTPLMATGEADDINPAVGLLVDALLYPKPSHSVTSPIR